MGNLVALLPAPVPLTPRHRSKHNVLGGAAALHVPDKACETQSPLAHGGLDVFLSTGLEKALGVRHGVARTFRLAVTTRKELRVICWCRSSQSLRRSVNPSRVETLLWVKGRLVETQAARPAVS